MLLEVFEGSVSFLGLLELLLPLEEFEEWHASFASLKINLFSAAMQPVSF